MLNLFTCCSGYILPAWTRHNRCCVFSRILHIYRSNDIHLSDHRYILLLIWFSQDSALTGIFYLNHSLWQWLQNNIQIPVPPPYLSVSIQHFSLSNRPSFSISFLFSIWNHEFSFIFQRFIIHYCIYFGAQVVPDLTSLARVPFWRSMIMLFKTLPYLLSF